MGLSTLIQPSLGLSRGECLRGLAHLFLRGILT